MPDDPQKTRASRFETLGAWLGIWTPPRDVVVPPVPWGKVGIGALALVVLGVFTALVIAPAIDDEKQRSAAEEQRALQRRVAARRVRMREEQRAVRGAVKAGGRAAALERVEAAIGVDAARRFDANGEPAACDPVAGEDAAAARVLYSCFATVREIVGAGDQEGASGAIAVPYRASIDFAARRYAFCKANPPAGEQGLPDPRGIVELPSVCRR